MGLGHELPTEGWAHHFHYNLRRLHVYGSWKDAGVRWRPVFDEFMTDVRARRKEGQPPRWLQKKQWRLIGRKFRLATSDQERGARALVKAFIAYRDEKRRKQRVRRDRERSKSKTHEGGFTGSVAGDVIVVNGVRGSVLVVSKSAGGGGGGGGSSGSGGNVSASEARYLRSLRCPTCLRFSTSGTEPGCSMLRDVHSLKLHAAACRVHLVRSGSAAAKQRETRTVYECFFCGKGFDTAGGAATHTATCVVEHSTDKGPCPGCARNGSKREKKKIFKMENMPFQRHLGKCIAFEDSFPQGFVALQRSVKRKGKKRKKVSLPVLQRRADEHECKDRAKRRACTLCRKKRKAEKEKREEKRKG